MATPAKQTALAQPALTQRRVLRNLEQGDRLWEVADEPYCTFYNERRGRNERVRVSSVQQMEALGWIQRVPNSAPNRLNSWELTAKGRAVFKAKSRP